MNAAARLCREALRAGFPPGYQGTEWFMLLHAYFDETEHAGSVFAIAGYIGTDDQWAAFTDGWTSTLECHYAFAPFHMVDFEASEIDTHSQFHGWTTERKKQLATELFSLIPNSGVRGVGQAILLDSFQNLSEPAREQLGDPYWLCFHNCIERLLVAVPDTGLVDLVFDRKDKFVEEAHKRYDFLVKRLPKEQAKRLFGLAFRDDEIVIPLQAADVLAYEVGKLLHNAFHFPTIPERASLKALRAKGNVQIGLWDRENLARALRRHGLS